MKFSGMAARDGADRNERGQAVTIVFPTQILCLRSPHEIFHSTPSGKTGYKIVISVDFVQGISFLKLFDQ